MTEWTEFAAGLAEHLAGSTAGTVVKISELNGARYAQFRQLDNEVWAELAGDAWLEPAVRAGDPGARVFTAAGWQPPDPDHGDNWWIEWATPLSPVRYRELAAMVVAGLRDGFRITEVTALGYEAWDENDGNRELELPELGLVRRD